MQQGAEVVPILGGGPLKVLKDLVQILQAQHDRLILQAIFRAGDRVPRAYTPAGEDSR
jgi:hypothetical protein